jgi:hypothetical protein
MEQLTPRAVQIMDLTIQGLKSGQIAERLGLTGAYVSTITSAANYQHQLAIRREKLENRIDDKVVNATVEAADVLKEHSVQAARNLVAMADGDKSPISLRANESVLDRVGVSKKSDGGIKMAQQVVIIDDKTAKTIQETLEMEKG